MRIFALGDIHGRIEALMEVLEASSFDYDNDKLIVLGDIADGGYNTYEVVEELLKIKNLIFILGNHDEWFINHIRTGWSGEIWTTQGGKNTIDSYKENNMNIPVKHQDFFNNAVFYYIQDNMLFVHGGINPHLPIISQEKFTLLWDRELINKIKNNCKTDYKEIYIGHTTTQSIMNDIDWMKPVCIQSVTTDLWCIDCGAGWNGKLCLLNVDTKEYFLSKQQSPAVRE
jgi:serine/threonine protein phosphatase 1